MRMKKIALILAAALPFCLAQQTAPEKTFFPLSRNSWWEYSGTAKISGNPYNSTMTMRMDVIEVIERNGIRAAWVRGNPMTLADSSQGAGDQVLGRIGTRMYLTSSARGDEIRQRMTDPGDKLAALFQDAEFLVDISTPVGPGRSFVGKDYQVVQTVRGGSRTIRFTPGVGISEFRYSLSGESGDVKLSASNVSPEEALP